MTIRPAAHKAHGQIEHGKRQRHVIQRHGLALEAEAFVLGFIGVLAKGFVKVDLDSFFRRGQAYGTGGTGHRGQPSLQAHGVVHHKITPLQRYRVKSHGLAAHVLGLQCQLGLKGEGRRRMYKALRYVQLHRLIPPVRQDIDIAAHHSDRRMTIIPSTTWQ